MKAGGVECLRQIDFIIVGTKNKWRLQNVDAEEDLYTGNDHRTLVATLRIKRKQSKSNTIPNKIKTLANLKSWEPMNKDEYAIAFDKSTATNWNWKINRIQRKSMRSRRHSYIPQYNTHKTKECGRSQKYNL